MLFEDNEDFRENLGSYIRGSSGLEYCGGYFNSADADKNVRQHQPDVILMDYQMPGADGLQGIQRIRKIDGNVVIIVLTSFEDEDTILRCVQEGANGYLLKSASNEEIVHTIRSYHDGKSIISGFIADRFLELIRKHAPVPQSDVSLTQSELEVLQGIVEGLQYKEIADRRHVSINTINTHIINIYRKLNVTSRSEAIVVALKKGFADLWRVKKPR